MYIKTPNKQAIVVPESTNHQQTMTYSHQTITNKQSTNHQLIPNKQRTEIGVSRPACPFPTSIPLGFSLNLRERDCNPGCNGLCWLEKWDWIFQGECKTKKVPSQHEMDAFCVQAYVTLTNYTFFGSGCQLILTIVLCFYYRFQH